MTTIIFQNPGLLDLRAVTTMGISTKPDSKNPIGMFGTGLKYAIAVTLREGGTFRAQIGSRYYNFMNTKEDFRGKSFDFIYYIETDAAWHPHAAAIPMPLGITTELGKKWEPWMAIRELESNVRDENGSSRLETSDRFPVYDAPNSTTIFITGATMVAAYSQLSSIFMMQPAIVASPQVSLHRPRDGKRSSVMYYRNVRCGVLERPALFDYNLHKQTDLTEDRTFKYGWEPINAIRSFLLQDCTDEDVLTQVLLADKLLLEHQLDFDVGIDPSETFIRIVQRYSARCNDSAWRMVRKHLKLTEWDEVELDEHNANMLSNADKFLSRALGVNLAQYQVRIAKDLGTNVLGRCYGGDIWLSLRIFEMGQKPLVSCLYEEYIHRDRGLQDNCYEMQTFLFDQIITLAAKLQKETL